jgi:hypothetical protein
VGAAPAEAPGLLIADRYRVEAALSDVGTGRRVGRLWRARDEVLARPVAILLVAADDPSVPEVLAGAQAAARLAHAAVVRVYDAGEVDGLAFVVTELLSGGSLERQLLTAPLDPVAAVDLVAELATGVTAAYAVGLHGLGLTPKSVLFTATGAPRLTGIALAKPPAPPTLDNAAQARLDTIGLANLLYAALTARWPGAPADSALPAAPITDGHLRTPRQVRGGVPREVDAVVAQTLGDEAFARVAPPIESPAAFAAALAPLRTSIEQAHPYGADTGPIGELEPRPGLLSAPRLAPARHWRRLSVIAIALLVLIALGVLFFPGSPGYQRFVAGAPAPTTTPSATATAATPTAAAAALGAVDGAISVAAINEFDPYGAHDDPHVSEVPRATDGNAATSWRTQIFKTTDLGKLKPGVGLLVDLGKPQKVGSVVLSLLGSGTNLTLLESNGSAAPTSDKEMTVAAQQTNAPAQVTLQLTSPATARYWVVWLTALPAVSGGFRGGVTEVAFLH